MNMAELKRGSAISASEISHSFRGTPAMKGVSLEIAAGEFCVLIGPSGCGKTTFMNMVAGEVFPELGDLEVLGDSASEGNPKIGYMYARDALLPWRTALENAAFGLEARGVPKAERIERARELLNAVGLGRAIDSYPSQLSHGMRQRVALARTFALNADVLLMDEPFAALDAQTRIMLEDQLTRLWEGQKSTVLFVTHDLAEAILLADRIVLFSAAPGEIKRVYDVPLPRPRSVVELQASPDFHELYERIWTDLESEVGEAARRNAEATH